MINESKLAQAFRDTFGIDPLQSEGVFALRSVVDFATAIGVQVCEDISRANPGRMPTREEKKRNASFARMWVPGAVKALVEPRKIDTLIGDCEIKPAKKEPVKIGIGSMIKVMVNDAAYLADVVAWEFKSEWPHRYEFELDLGPCGRHRAYPTQILSVRDDNDVWHTFSPNFFVAVTGPRQEPGREAEKPELTFMEEWKAAVDISQDFEWTGITVDEIVMRHTWAGAHTSVEAKHGPSGISVQVPGNPTNRSHKARAMAMEKLRETLVQHAYAKRFRHRVSAAVTLAIAGYCAMGSEHAHKRMTQMNAERITDAVADEFFNKFDELGDSGKQHRLWAALEREIGQNWQYVDNWRGLAHISHAMLDNLRKAMQEDINKKEKNG
ncbi:hypothetical protein JXVLWARM_CDS_0074 [Burkholderia phage Bm1]